MGIKTITEKLGKLLYTTLRLINYINGSEGGKYSIFIVLSHCIIKIKYKIMHADTLGDIITTLSFLINKNYFIRGAWVVQFLRHQTLALVMIL